MQGKNKDGLDKIKTYYSDVDEAGRLSLSLGQLEQIRTREIIGRYLPPPPGVVLDVGGAAGVYAFWLAGKSYEVYLIDPVPLHIEQAEEVSRNRPEAPLAGLTVGDAFNLEHPDSSVDAVLLLGPLYHLVEREDRLKALVEAGRVLKKGGPVFAAAISRFASLLDGLVRGFLEDPDFQSIVDRDLKEGQHRNPSGHPDYFTDAYFHLPEELVQEVEESGLTVERLIAVDGLGCLLPDFEAQWTDPARRSRLLRYMEIVESEPSLLGAGSHLLAVARKA